MWFALWFQDKSTTGKQGLGIKDRKKKVAGCYFQGKKTSFDDSDDEGSADRGSPEEVKQYDLLEIGSVNEPKVKLKKLCKQLLRQVSPEKLFIWIWIFKISPVLIDSLFQAPGESLKLKALKALIDEHSSSVFSNFSSKRDALVYLRQKVWAPETMSNILMLVQIDFPSQRTYHYFPQISFHFSCLCKAMTLLVVTAAGRQHEVYCGREKSESQIADSLKILVEIEVILFFVCQFLGLLQRWSAQRSRA